jgi:AcrR family transcriptional regulator
MASRHTRQDSDAEDVRGSLLRAAEACFDRYGVAKTTMEDVAKAAGVSRWTIYKHFDDRESLILGVLLPRGRQTIARTHDHIRRYKTFADQLVEGQTFLLIESVNDEIGRMLLDPQYSDLADRIGSSDALVELAVGLWEPLIAEAQERGEVAPDLDVRQACQWLIIVGIAMASHLDPQLDNIEEVRSMMRRFVVPAFMASPTAVADRAGPKRARR